MALPETEPFVVDPARAADAVRAPPARRAGAGAGAASGSRDGRPRDAHRRGLGGAGRGRVRRRGWRPGARGHRRDRADGARGCRGVVGSTRPAVRPDPASGGVRAARWLAGRPDRRGPPRTRPCRRGPLGRGGRAQGGAHRGRGTRWTRGASRRSRTPPWAPAARATCWRASSRRCWARGCPRGRRRASGSTCTAPRASVSASGWVTPASSRRTCWWSWRSPGATSSRRASERRIGFAPR